jgi:hypothetical protein
MHQFPIIVALLISLLCGAAATALVAELEIPAGPKFGAF